MDASFEAGDGSPVAVEPSERAFELPTAFVPAHSAAVVARFGGAILAVRGEEFDALLGERFAECVGVVSAVGDQGTPSGIAIDTAKLSGLRDPALIAVMVFSFALVSAAVALKTEDYYQDGKRWWFRFREKGGKQHQVPAHPTAEGYLDAYLLAARVGDDKKARLFRSVTGMVCSPTGK